MSSTQDPFASLAAARTASEGKLPETKGVTDKQQAIVVPAGSKLFSTPAAARGADKRRASSDDQQREHISFHVPRWVLRAVDEYRVRSASLTGTAPAARAEILRSLLETGARSLSHAEAFVRERRTTSER